MKKTVFRRLFACLLSFVFLAAAGGASAGIPDYPPIAEGLDFGGRTVWIYDWWHTDNESHSARESDPDEETQLRYDYVDWLESTYNCRIVETALSDWSGNPAELMNMVMNRDDSVLCVIAVASDYISTVLNNRLFMPWTVGLDGGPWNRADLSLMTRDGVVCGVHPGETEPRQCVYFNKHVLQGAGIDPETLYDAQADGTWTWAMMEDLLDRLQGGAEEGRVLLGSGEDLAVGLMYSNGARFFDFDGSGDLVIAAGRPEALSALAKYQEWSRKYMVPQPAGSGWDWYKDYWKQGVAAFYAGQTWQGFNDDSEMADMEDEWGCVMFPMGPDASAYLAAGSDNIYGVPNVYDEKTSEMIQQIVTLYFMDTPGVETDGAWIGNKYFYTDDRAVEETYAMMREPKHSAPNYAFLLGPLNDVVSGVLLWGPLDSLPAAEAVESVKPFWQDLLDSYNAR